MNSPLTVYRRHRINKGMRLLGDAQSWIYQRGYAAGHADGAAETSKCRRPDHIHPSEAPIATTCDACVLEIAKDVKWIRDQSVTGISYECLQYRHPECEACGCVCHA